MTVPMIWGADGTPMKRAPIAASAGMPAYQAADPFSQELAGWHPGLGSADSDLIANRDEIVARARDLARNNGWASSAVTRCLGLR